MRSRTAPTPPTAAPASKAGDDDVENRHDAINNSFQDGADAVDDCHEACSDGLEDGFDTGYNSTHFGGLMKFGAGDW